MTACRAGLQVPGEGDIRTADRNKGIALASAMDRQNRGRCLQRNEPDAVAILTEFDKVNRTVIELSRRLVDLRAEIAIAERAIAGLRN